MSPTGCAAGMVNTADSGLSATPSAARMAGPCVALVH
jgi:hypothetical protein